MNIGANIDKFHTFINLQMNPHSRHQFTGPQYQPAVTISRQAGVNAMVIAEELAELLHAHTPAANPWMIFDKNLAEKVLEDHQLPKEIAKFMPEDRVSAIHDAVEEILGLHPSSRTLLHLTSETIMHLAEFGHVIMIGRAANVITQHMKNVFHVRLIAPLDKRVTHLMSHRQLTDKAAREFIQKHDQSRKHYLKNNFHADIDDNLLYDLVINTARLSHGEVAHLIANTILHWGKPR